MSSPLLAFALKLPLALLVFLVIAYAGMIDRRIAGVLFTFPILNGIAIIASPEPVIVADAIYPLVIFNCVLFACVISFPKALPAVGTLPRTARLFARVAVWSLAWLAGAWLITDFRAMIPGAAVLFSGASIFALVFIVLFWTIVESIGGVRGLLLFFPASKILSFLGDPTRAARLAVFFLPPSCLFFLSRGFPPEERGGDGG